MRPAFILLSVAWLFSLLFTVQADAVYTWRQVLTSNTSTLQEQAPDGTQIKVNYTYNTNLTCSDFSCIAFSNSTNYDPASWPQGTGGYPYWIEEIAGTTATIWVRIGNFTQGVNNAIYIYGNNTTVVTSRSNGNNTFPDYFDDFDAINNSVYKCVSATCSILGSSTLNVSGTGSNVGLGRQTQNNYSVVLEMNASIKDGTETDIGWLNTFGGNRQMVFLTDNTQDCRLFTYTGVTQLTDFPNDCNNAYKVYSWKWGQTHLTFFQGYQFGANHTTRVVNDSLLNVTFSVATSQILANWARIRVYTTKELAFTAGEMQNNFTSGGGDTTAPQFTGNASLANNTTYSVGLNIWFQINGTFDAKNATFEGNLNSSGASNYSVTNSTPDIFSVNFTNISAGTYAYRWYLPDPSSNVNSTANITITIAKALVPLQMSGSNKTIPNNVTVSCGNSRGQPDKLTCSLFRNSTNVTSQNNSLVSLSAGFYAYVANYTETQNYSVNTSTLNINVSKNSTNLIDLWINGNLNQNTTISVGSNATVTGNFTLDNQSNSTPYGNVTLWLNGTPTTYNVRTNPVTLNLTSGYYLLKANTSGNENYTQNFTGQVYQLYVQDTSAPQSYGNSSAYGNPTYNSSLNHIFNISASDASNITSVIFRIDNVNYTTQTVVTNQSYGANVTGLVAGTYEYIWYICDQWSNCNTTEQIQYRVLSGGGSGAVGSGGGGGGTISLEPAPSSNESVIYQNNSNSNNTVAKKNFLEQIWDAFWKGINGEQLKEKSGITTASVTGSSFAIGSSLSNITVVLSILVIAVLGYIFWKAYKEKKTAKLPPSY